MIFRLSQKLNTKIKAGTLTAMPLADNPFADWSANLFVSGRTQYILLSNTKSLYSTVMPGKAINDNHTFIEQSLKSLRELLEDGHTGIYAKLIAPFSNTVNFAKSLDRAVIGSMNELTVQATYSLGDGESRSSKLNTELNTTLLSAVASSKTEKYGKPSEVFRAMVQNGK